MISFVIKPNKLTHKVQINYHENNSGIDLETPGALGIWWTWPMSRLLSKFSTCLSDIAIFGTLNSKPKHFLLWGTHRSEFESEIEDWVLQTRAYFLQDRKFWYYIKTACFKASSEFWYPFIVMSNRSWRYFPRLCPQISLSMVWLSAADEISSQAPYIDPSFPPWMNSKTFFVSCLRLNLVLELTFVITS